MYYPDLSYYRDIGNGGIANIYPEFRNVGWLWRGQSYTKGHVSSHLIQKIKEILFLDLKNSEDKRNGIFDRDRAICIHSMYVRGRPHHCQFCDKGEIRVKPTNLEYYTGSCEKILGNNEVSIPALEKREFYVFPTMIYHYIVEHDYQPPQEFLEALNAFDLSKPYDIDEAQSDEVCLEVPVGEVDQLHLKPIPQGLYSFCRDDLDD